MTISKEKIDEFKNILEADKQRIEANIETLGEDVDFGDSPGMDNEEADEGEEAANVLATIETLKARVSNIDAALKRIDNGTYGICENCGEEIEMELLEANPESAVCKTHKG